jgi:hypothetical protein
MILPMDMSEKQIEHLIIAWLNAQPGCFAFKQDVQARYDRKISAFRKLARNVPRGGADILFVMNGRFGAFEVKRKRAFNAAIKNPDSHVLRQYSFLERVNACGGFGRIVCSLDQVQEYIAAEFSKRS